jgi:hypothetical protein
MEVRNLGGIPVLEATATLMWWSLVLNCLTEEKVVGWHGMYQYDFSEDSWIKG